MKVTNEDSKKTFSEEKKFAQTVCEYIVSLKKLYIKWNLEIYKVC